MRDKRERVLLCVREKGRERGDARGADKGERGVTAVTVEREKERDAL